MFSSPSSFMNSRTDSSAVSTAKETRLFMDCLRLFLAPAFIAPAPGLAIFTELDAPEHKEKKDLEKDVEMLTKAWTNTRDWNELWNTWKGGLCGTIGHIYFS